MIFQRALRRELISTAGAVFTALFTISITWMLIKILGQAAGGKIASGDVVALIGFSAMRYLPNILILTSFISVLLVVTRSYQDSEMVVWFSSGLSLSQWIQPIVLCGLPIILLTGLLSFVGTPWAIRQSAVFEERFEKRDDISKIAPGKFMESAAANRIFFVEGISGDATKVQNIFVNTFQNGRTSLIVAKEGATEIDRQGNKFVVMQKGRRYDGAPDQPDFEVMEFERYGMFVADRSQSLIGDKSARALSVWALVKDQSGFNKGELLWRIASPVMCLLLMLLALPLGFVNPRAGRSVNLIVALLLYFTYYNMVSIFQEKVKQGHFSFGLSWWPVHMVAALIIVMLFFWRVQVNSRYHPLVLWARIKRLCLLKRKQTI